MNFNANSVSRRTLLQGAASASASAMFWSVTTATQAIERNTISMPRISPENAGIREKSILAFINSVDQTVGGLHGFMLVRHGAVVAEGHWKPYDRTTPHMLYSLSKSFTSTAGGFAVAEGRLSVDDLVVSFFLDKSPAGVDKYLARMRVRHLLTMNTGHEHDATGPVTASPDGDWVKTFLSLPVEHEPGTKFVYNSAATYMISAIVQKLTGMKMVDYLKPRLFDPLGIHTPPWETCPKGINTGGWGLRLKTEDIARFGQCYLQNGKWDGMQVVPAGWVKAASSKQVSNGDGGASDWTQGYGYQFWRCRHNAFRGDGAFGQYCIVLPEQDAVIAITSGVSDMQSVLNSVWDHLLPGMQSAPQVPEVAGILAGRLKKLESPFPTGAATSITTPKIHGGSYRLGANPDKLDTISIEATRNRITLKLSGDGVDQKLVSGHGEWVSGLVERPRVPRLGAAPTGKIATRGAWTESDTYTMKVCYTETPYNETVTLKFAGEMVTISRKMNVAFGPTELPTLVGHIT